ncbi:MAG: hypothetical protein U0746_02660 [Gemmataceae bacterium]
MSSAERISFHDGRAKRDVAIGSLSHAVAGLRIWGIGKPVDDEAGWDDATLKADKLGAHDP